MLHHCPLCTNVSHPAGTGLSKFLHERVIKKMDKKWLKLEEHYSFSKIQLRLQLWNKTKYSKNKTMEIFSRSGSICGEREKQSYVSNLRLEYTHGDARSWQHKPRLSILCPTSTCASSQSASLILIYIIH